MRGPQNMTGLVPGWFPSVPRGELQACLEWAKLACSPSSFYTDCQWVFEGFSTGIPKKYTSSASEHADLWRQAKWAMDDHDGGLSIFKVKAHRSRARAIEEDGEEGDKLWAGNDAADAAAKSLAKTAWESREVGRRSVEELRTRAQDLMIRAAICTHMAQRMFDKLGIPRAPARRNKAHRPQDISTCGDHVLERRPDGQGRWCAACHLVANTVASRRSLRARPCTGAVTERIPPSHHLQYSAGVLWCRKCAAYTTRLPRALQRQCPGHPPSAAARNIQRRLMNGLPPTTALYLKGRGQAWNEEIAMAFDVLQNQRRLDGDTPGRAPARRANAPRKATSGRRLPERGRAPPPEERHDHHLPHHLHPRSIDVDDGDVAHAPALVQAVYLSMDDVSDPTASSSSEIPGQRPPSAACEKEMMTANGIHGRPEVDVHGKGGGVVPIAASTAGAPRRQHDNDRHRVKYSTRGNSSCTMEMGATSFEAARTDGATVVMNPWPDERDHEGALIESQLQAEVIDFCRPADGAPWTRRILMQASWSRQGCHLCGASTSATCRGCGRGLCITCSRNRLSCQAVHPLVAPTLAKKNMSCSEPS